MPVPRRRSALAAARKASGHTQESLASALQVDRTAVARWEAGQRTPLPHIQPMLARLLGQTPAELRALIAPDDRPQGLGIETPASASLSAAFNWLDEHAGWPSGTSRSRVVAMASRVDRHEIDSLNLRRDKVSREAVVHALHDFYPASPDYRVKCAGQSIRTGVVSQPEWLDLACSLTGGADQLTLTGSTPADDLRLDEVVRASL